MTARLGSTRWAALLALTAILAACGAAVTPAPEPAANPEPAAPQASCADVAISVLERGAGVHGAIVSDTLHMGAATAPATCMDPANQSLDAGLSMPDHRTAQVRQSQYYLIVIRYPGGNRLYVLSRRADGSSCVVDTNDQCIARVTDLPDDFDLETLPDDVAPTIPAGRPAPPTVGPSPGDDETPPAPGDETPPAPGPAPGDETPPAPSPPPGDGAPPPGDGAPPPVAGTPPGSATSPQPSDAATGVTVGGPLLSWAAAPRALSYDVYWGAENTDLDTPINTSLTALRIAASADLDADTLYYWRVDAKNEAGTTRGTVWSFTTAPAAAPPPPAPPPAEEPPPAADFTLSLTQDHYRFAEEGGAGGTFVIENRVCSPHIRRARNRPTDPCHFAYTWYTITVKVSGVFRRSRPYPWVKVRFSLEDGTAHGQTTLDSHAEGDRKDYYHWIDAHDWIRNGGTSSVGFMIIQDDIEEEDETLYVNITPLSTGVNHEGGRLQEDDPGSKVVACERCRAKITIIDND